MKNKLLERVKTHLKNNWYVDRGDIQALIDIAQHSDIEKIRDTVDDELWDVLSSAQLLRLHRAFDIAEKRLRELEQRLEKDKVEDIGYAESVQDYFAWRNGGKTAEQMTKNGEHIPAIWVVKLMEDYAKCKNTISKNNYD